MKTKIPLSAGAILPRDMNFRQFAEFMQSQATHFIRAGQTAYDTGEGIWFGDDGGTVKFSVGNSAGNKVTWDGSTLTVVGDITIENVDELSDISANMGTLTAGIINLSGTGALIKSGVTAYNNGTGWILEYNGGTPRFFIGNSAGNNMRWDGSAFSITVGSGDNTLTWDGSTFTGRGVGSFTTNKPITSFNVTGFIDGTLDDGAGGDAATYIYAPSQFVALSINNLGISGTSDANTFQINNVPAVIQGMGRIIVPAIDNGNVVLAMAEIQGDADIIFHKAVVSGTEVQFSATGWTTSGSKGLPGGTALVWPLV